MLLTKLNSAPVNFWRQGETMTSCYPHCYSTTCTSRDTMQCLSLAETWARDVPLPDLTWYRDSVTSHIHRNSLKKIRDTTTETAYLDLRDDTMLRLIAFVIIIRSIRCPFSRCCFGTDEQKY